MRRFQLLAYVAIVLPVGVFLWMGGRGEPPPMAREAGVDRVFGDCLPYGPQIELAGRMERETFPGPPNYESIEAGDDPETYWILHLPTPVCAQAGDEPDEGQERNVTRVQLVLAPDHYRSYRPMLGRHVIASGTLMQRLTGHHHTPLLLQVHSLRMAVEQPAM